MNLLDFILNIDKHLITIVNSCGDWTYLILFLIVFVETGLVVFPFLPGDSLIFTTIAMAASPKYHLDLIICYIIFIIAAICGDSINYELGKWSELQSNKFKWFNKLINPQKKKAAEDFFEKHGGITIVIGRFIPIIRTFVPFVSGASKMHYRTFVIYNIVGAFLWVSLFSICGFLFGNIPAVQHHFSLLIIAIIAISILPIIILSIKNKLTKNSK